MKKQLFTIIFAGIMVLSICGCENERREVPSGIAAEAENKQNAGESEANVPEEKEPGQVSDEVSVFAEFEYLDFMFLSGAGGWATYMEIEPDGSFSGKYFDGELGVTGEGYPNGTQYQCDFTGKFTEPVKVADFTWSMRIQEISYEKEPGYPLAELPEEYRSWVGYYDLSGTEETELPFWGLYNVAQECGFSSYNIIEQVRTGVAAQGEWAAELENSLQNETLSQTDRNLTSKQLYDVWDYVLNDVWSVLMRVLDEKEKAALLAEEREWIAMKEAAAEEAGAKLEGGTMRSVEMNLAAAELTKLRVYELLELLPAN